jgi:hypothetical protein
VNQRDRLIDTLQALEALLDRHKVRFASVVTDLLKAVPASSDSDIKAAVRELFRGTMGSLTDQYITRKNGHIVEDEAAASTELEPLTSRLWDLSK